MEFLRFGSSIPGSYWGCCAVCIIQNFKVSPSAPASIELVDGDGGTPLNGKYLGMTYKDVFLNRLKIGTFSFKQMPNHGFIAILTDWQVGNGVGKEWLAILKEQGFEFIRTVDNSVYTGDKLIGDGKVSSHKNYIFGLFRNVGAGSVEDQFTPPKEWTDLPTVVPEAWGHIPDPISLTHEVMEAQLPLYKALGPVKFYTEAELEAAGVPVTVAGRRSDKPQQLKKNRKDSAKSEKAAPAPFAPVPVSVTA